ncbi:hypothetical protein [Amycolatopsis sp. NPDC004079]|uniref:hypothetical protein n=1 Tax=Amycolatopsis sp. NPDC004079 TaxID=3154549 RepID=UPI00339F9A10
MEPKFRELGTLELTPGMRVAIGSARRITRTVGQVTDSGCRTARGLVIYCVRYDGPVPNDGWSDGNSGTAETRWTVFEDSIPAADTRF